MTRYSIKSRKRKYVNRYGLLSFIRKHKKQLLDTGTNSSKTTSKKVVHKAGGFLGNKIADKVTKSSDGKIEKKEPVPEIIVPPEKGEEMLNKFRKVL